MRLLDCAFCVAAGCSAVGCSAIVAEAIPFDLPQQEPRRVLIAHAETCTDERDDVTILASIAEGAGEIVSLNEKRRRRLADDLTAKRGPAVDLANSLLSHAYYRLKSERWHDTQNIARRRRQRVLLSANNYSLFDSPIAEHLAEQRRLSIDTDLERRRDRLVALLEVAVNMEVLEQGAGDKSFISQNYKPLESTYLNRLRMDVVEGATPNALLAAAEQLPCLAIPPELDREKDISAIYPNDLRRSTQAGVAHQWALLGPNTSPQEPYGSDVVGAWEVVTGSQSPGMVVAIVDTGCSMHPDLEASMCKSGDDCEGYDFGDDDDNPFDEPLSKVHGTMVTSIIAARPNNQFGIAGVCWNCRIMCLKVFNSNRNTIELSSILKAYNYLVAKKVKLSNHSYISFGWSNAEYLALQELEKTGHLFVAAAGNFACNLDTPRDDGTVGCVRGGRDYGMAAPASYPLESILTVGSIAKDGTLSDFSNWGMKSVDLMAPGTNAVALFNTAQYGTSTVGRVSGTSFACPLVVGIAALVWNRKPTMTNLEVKEILMKTVEKLPSLDGRCISGGTINAAAAVRAVAEGITDKPLALANAPKKDNTLVYYGKPATDATEKDPTDAAYSALSNAFSLITLLFAGLLLLC